MICYFGDVQEFVSTALCRTYKEGEEANINKIFDHYFGVHPIVDMLPRQDGLSMGANCTLHYKKIVERAKAIGLPYVTVFESDAYPRADAASVLPALLSNIPDDAHFIFWGTIRGSSMNPAEFGKETFKRFGYSLPGCQAVTILEAGYQDIFDLYEEGSEGIDHGMSGKPGAYHCDPNLFLQCNIIRSCHRMLGYNGSEKVPVGWDDIDTILVKEDYSGHGVLTPDYFISNAICMTCRPHEGDRLCKIFDYYFGCHPQVRFFKVRNGLSGDDNITQNWIEMLSDAKRHDIPYVTVFESDAVPCYNSRVRLEECLSMIPANADAIMWGASRVCYQYDKRNSASLFEHTRGHVNGAYSVTVFRKAYDKLLDIIASHPERHIDQVISNLLQNVYFLRDVLFIVHNEIGIPTVHGHTGYYSYALGLHDYPPPFFDDISNILNDASSRTMQDYDSVMFTKNFIESAIVMTKEKDEANNLVKLFDYYLGTHPSNIKLFPVRKDCSARQNITLNWKNIIENAKQEDLDYVTVFESDAFPRRDVAVSLTRYIKMIPKEAGVVFWGHHGVKGASHDCINKIFKKANWIGGSHAVTIFKKAYDRVLSLINNRSDVDIDRLLSSLSDSLFLIDSLFIQYNAIPSSCSHFIGYTPSSSRGMPPAGFDDASIALPHVRAVNINIDKDVVRIDRRNFANLSRILNNTFCENMTVLEIGCYAGERTHVFASHPKVSKVYAVDTWEDDSLAEDRFDQVSFCHRTKVVKFRGSMQQFLNDNHGVKIDLVFLNCPSDYQTVVKNIQLAQEKGVRFICGNLYEGKQKKAVDDVLDGPTYVLADGLWCADKNLSLGIDDFSHAFVIATSEDEFDRVDRRLKAAGFSFSLEMIDGRIERNPYIAKNNTDKRVSEITYSHIYAIEQAKRRGYKNCTVFESDTSPSIDAYYKMHKMASGEIPASAGVVLWGNNLTCENSDWHVHVGGKYLRLCNGRPIWGSHAYTIFQHYYDYYLDYAYSHEDWICDYWHKLDSVYVPRKNLFLQMHQDGVPDHVWHDVSTDKAQIRFVLKDSLYDSGLKKLWRYIGGNNGFVIVVNGMTGAMIGEDHFRNYMDLTFIRPTAMPDDDLGMFDILESNMFQVMSDRVVKEPMGTFIARHRMPIMMFYFNGGVKTPALRFDMLAALSAHPMYIAGHDWRNSYVKGVVREVLGEPDGVFDDTVWIKKVW